MFELSRINTTEEFGTRLSEAIKRFGRLLEWPDEKLEKFYKLEKKNDYNNEIRFAAEVFIKRLNKRMQAKSEHEEPSE